MTHTKPTIEQLREAFPGVAVNDEMMQDPFYLVGVLTTELRGKPEFLLCLDVIFAALQDGRRAAGRLTEIRYVVDREVA